jgi:hypothetical protein
MISQTGYPYVWNILDLNIDELFSISKKLIKGQYNNQIISIKETTQLKAEKTLTDLNSLLKRIQA